MRSVVTTDVSLSSRILKLAGPVAMQQLLQSLMFFVDTVMVGRLSQDTAAGSSPLAAMQLAGPLCWTSMVLFTFFSIGTGACVSRATGEKDYDKVRRAAGSSLVIAGAAGLLVAWLGQIFAEPLLRWYAGAGVREATLADATSYFSVFCAAAPIHFLSLVAAGALRGTGDTFNPMVAGIVANLVNVALNYAFLTGSWGCPALGMPGTSVATSAAMGVSLVYLFHLLFRKAGGSPTVRPIGLGAGDLVRPDGALSRTVLRVSLPALLEAVVTHSAFLSLQRIISHLSEIDMSAHRIAISLESFAFLPAYGLYVASATMAGQDLGAGNPQQAERSVRMTARTGAIAFLAISLLFLAIPEFLARIFLVRADANAETIRLAALCLRIGAIEIPLIAAAMSLYGGLQGSGDTRSPLLVSFVGGWLVRVPGAWFLGITMGWGLGGIWCATVVDWAVRLWLFDRAFRRGRWKEIRL